MMASRSIWNGTVRMGNLALPVKLHSAVQDKTVRFHLLHDRDRQRVRQRLVNPETGEEIAPGDVRRAYEVEPGVFVVVEEKELAELEPKPSKDIEITRFIPYGQSSYVWYERPYYLAPNGDAKDYFALAEALAKSKREGVARWVMRNHAYVGALRASDGYLMLVALRHAGEVIDASSLPAPSGPALTAKELAMAEQLVTMLEERYDPAAFHDEYRERLEKLIAAKAHHKVYRFERPAPKRRTEDLDRALAASLTRIRKERKSA
jgi:DNA end-binding protein Ku